MQKKPGDLIVGAIMVGAVVIALGFLWGQQALLTVGLACLDVAVALHLWRKKNLGAKALAVALLPVLLLERFFLPKNLKQSLVGAGRKPANDSKF